MYLKLLGSCAIGLLSVIAVQAGSSDVADAVMRRDMSALRALLQQKADVNVPQFDRATALHWAAYQGDVTTANLLIQAGAKVNVANRDGATPLSVAATNGDAAFIQVLLAAGANPNEHLPFGKTALMMASRAGAVEAMKLLLDRGADVNAKEALRGTTALMWATSEGHPAAVQLLVSRGADVSVRSNPAPHGVGPYLSPGLSGLRNSEGGFDVKDEGRINPNKGRRPDDLTGGGLTPLVYAARENDLESARILLTAKADLNQTTTYGWTPLMVATQNRNYKLASFLLEKGADPNLANQGGWTPLYLAVDNRNPEGGDYPVRKPDMDHFEFIKDLMRHGADPNARMIDTMWSRSTFTNKWLDEYGATAFLRASRSSDLAVMRLLLSNGADPKIKTHYDTSALHVAAGISWVEGITYEWSAEANVEAVKLLLDLGLDPNAQNNLGMTPLMGAAMKGRNPVVQLLVDRGADIGLRDYGSRLAQLREGSPLFGHKFLPLDYTEGLIKYGTQSSIPQPETSALIRKLMVEAGLPVPPPGRTLETVCDFEVCENAAQLK